jgi:hypothetical protein
MDKKEQEALSKHEWWIDLLSFFIFVGACVLLTLLGTTMSPSSPILFMLLGGLIVAYFFLHKKLKKFLISLLSGNQ